MKKKELLDELQNNITTMFELMQECKIDPYIADDALDLPVDVIRKAHHWIRDIHSQEFAAYMAIYSKAPNPNYWKNLHHYGLSHSHEAQLLNKARKAFKVAFNNPPDFFKIEKVNRLLKEKKHGE